MSIVHLDSIFERPEYRKVNASDRAPITRLLEDLFDSLIELVQPQTTMEVGAFEADFSRRMKKRFPTAEVLAFEANPRVYEQYAEAASSNGVDYRHLAIGAEAGTAHIHIPIHIGDRDMPFVNRMGSLNVIQMQNSEVVSVEVPTQRLDDVCRNISPGPAVLWIDVEGAIDQVLAGAHQTLSRCTMLFCELELSQVWSGQLLSGEIRSALADSGFLPVARDCQKAFQYNAIFMRSEFLIANPTAQGMIESYIEEAMRQWTTIVETSEE